MIHWVAASIRPLASPVARGVVVAYPNFPRAASGDSAAHLGCLAPNQLGVVTTHLPGAAGISCGIVVLCLVRPGTNNFGRRGAGTLHLEQVLAVSPLRPVCELAAGR